MKSLHQFLSVAGFEFGYQLRNPVLWVSFTLFFLLTFGAVTVDEIQIGGTGNTNINSPFAINQTMMVMGAIVMTKSKIYSSKYTGLMATVMPGTRQWRVSLC